jgi:hypothetical protein
MLKLELLNAQTLIFLKLLGVIYQDNQNEIL